MRIQPIIPAIRRAEAFDDSAWAFELKLDGFRGMADTIEGRLLSKQGNRMKPFERLLEGLPRGYVFDGEIVCLDGTGKPTFNDLLFRRGQPIYIAFDVLSVDGADVRGLPLKDRRACRSQPRQVRRPVANCRCAGIKPRASVFPQPSASGR